MEFLVHHRDRPGSQALRRELLEQHWAYMDRFAAAMVARGPTFAGDGTLTGSVHILALPDVATARAFALDEPGYQAGAYRDVLLRRWHNVLGRTMWESGVDREAERHLVLGFTREPRADDVEAPAGDLVAFGSLLSDDGAFVLGVAALVEAPDEDGARAVLPPGRYDGVEVHRWRPGGRPA